MLHIVSFQNGFDSWGKDELVFLWCGIDLPMMTILLQRFILIN